MKSLNLVMIVRNEERCIERCLKSVKDLVDEIVIVDTGSADKTKEIAARYGAKIFDFEWCQDFAAARNYALEKSNAHWNLVLDGDEWVIDGCRSGLEAFMENPLHLGAIEVQSEFKDKDKLRTRSNFITRLLPKGIRFTGRIHEQAESDLPRTPVQLTIKHDGYLQPKKEERNLPILMSAMKEAPNDPYFLYHISETYYNMKDYKEAAKYFRQFATLVPDDANYKCQGISDYIYTLMELEEWEQALGIIEKEKDNLQEYADFHFASGIFYMKIIVFNTAKYISLLSKIEASYLRCLEIGEVIEHGGSSGAGSFKAAYNLATWYEVVGDKIKAEKYYKQAEIMEKSKDVINLD